MSTKSGNGKRFGVAMLALAVTGLCGSAAIAQEQPTATQQLEALCESESMDEADIARVRELIDAGADVNSKEGATLLSTASGNGHTEIVKLLLDAKADVNAARKIDGMTPLHTASANGHVETVKLLLGAQANVNAADTDGRTPLSMASLNGHTETVKLLLDARANVNAAKTNGMICETISEYYVWESVVRVAEALITKGSLTAAEVETLLAPELLPDGAGIQVPLSEALAWAIADSRYCR